MNILHITAHMGGGIGTVISGVCIRDSIHKHSILCLEESQDRRKLEECIANQISIYYWNNYDIKKLLDQFDIVQIEWWHHPLTTKFMVYYLGEIKTRLAIWSHISGCNFPMISYPLVRYPDIFIFATPYSYDNPFWNEQERTDVRMNSVCAVSSGNDFSSPAIAKKPHKGFVVGYVGFLGYEKTNPDFVKICEGCADIPDIKFRIVGNTIYGQELLRDVQLSSHSSLFEFRGFSEQVEQELAEFDLFICPLQKEHTGASENALLEAMYAGICPIVFKQCTEQYLVIDKETGIVCNDNEEFCNAIRTLYKNPQLREELGRNASSFVSTHYSIQHTIEALHRAYQIIEKKEKKIHPASMIFGNSPAEWFLSCYGQDKKKIRGLANRKSKGSIHQYFTYFPDDELKKLIEEGTK